MTGEGTPGSVHRVSAGVIEEFIRDRVAKSLTATWRPEDEIDVRLFTAIKQATVSATEIELHIDPAALQPDAVVTQDSDVAVVRLAFHMNRRQGALILNDGSGPARDAVKGFPDNLNVSAALSLAGIGPDATEVTITAVPGLTRNCHLIEVEGEFGRLEVRIENIPSENPKTGRLTALSIIRAIQDAVDVVRIGS